MLTLLYPILLAAARFFLLIALDGEIILTWDFQIVHTSLFCSIQNSLNAVGDFLII